LVYGSAYAIRSELLRTRFPSRIFSCIWPALICAAALIFPGIARTQSGQKPGSRKLLVISVAGLDARFLAEPPTRVKIPNIRRMMRQGTVSSGVVGVAPSDTWPSEISIVTGVLPSENSVTTISLWQAAAKIGLKTAAIYWPATIGAEIGFDLPAPGKPQPGRNVQFDDVAQKSSPAGIVERIEKSAPGFQKELWDDSSATRAAVYLLHAEKPDMLLVQLSDVDSEQRETGSLSVYARDMLENDDELIGQILGAAAPGTVVALVSGHGFENENYIVRPRVLLRLGKQAAADIPVEVEDGLIGTTNPAVAERLRRFMSDGHRHGIAREVPMAEVKARVPSLAHWVAAFDTPLNYVASAEDQGPALGPGTRRGVTGFWPMSPGYRSVFVLSGEGVPARRLGEIDLLQIAPTLAEAMGLELPQGRKSLWPSISH
jgi:predicted AlkP superfamily pyrophosphatase or phosphodiesterase